MQSESVNRLSRKNKRGVSPIIATILLVAITVVLAAVLYILVTGLLTHTSTTSSIGLAAGTPAQCTNGVATTPATFNTYPVTIASTTSTITTANFGLKVVPAGSNTPTVPAASTSATPGTCPGASPSTAAGWVAVLQSASGSNVAVFDSGGVWSTTASLITCTGTCPTLPITISGGMTIIVVSSAAQTQASLQVYGLGGASISGAETI